MGKEKKFFGKKKAILITAAALVVVMAAAFVAVYMTAFIRLNPNRPLYDPTEFNKELTAEEVRADIEELIEKTEEIYVGFIDGEPEGYEEAKEKLRASAAAMKTDEFALKVMEFLAVFRDTHTTVAYKGFETLDFYNIAVYFDGERYVSAGTSLIPRGAVLTAINQVPIEDIVNLARPCLPFENDHTNKSPIYLSPIFLRAAGAEPDGINSLEYYYQNERKTVHIPMITVTEYEAFYGRARKNIECSIIQTGVLYIDYNAAYDDGDLQPALDYITDALQNKGIKKVIIDARGNGGGNDAIGNKILDTLGLKYSSADFIIKYSPEATRQNGFLRNFGSQRVKGKIDFENKYNIELKVFCDENTMSAASTLISQVKFSGLGEIIGRASGQRPNYRGNPVFLQLSNSRIVYALATTEMDWSPVYQWEIGDKLEPDTVIGYTDDPMAYVTFG